MSKGERERARERAKERGRERKSKRESDRKSEIAHIAQVSFLQYLITRQYKQQY